MNTLPIVPPRATRKGFRVVRKVKWMAAFIAVVFLLPAAASAAWWSLQERPATWRAANWRSSGVLPPAEAADAGVYVLAARTGGMKGAISVHSWLVLKKPGATSYDRYDKVGWGSPIRRNAYDADGFWYSNRPWVALEVTGKAAERLIPQVEAAIAAYPHSQSGGYTIWPGPNSNSFVAHVLDAVPALGARAPANATGRDFATGHVSLRVAPDWRDVHVTLGGLAGFAAGARSGIEIHFLGLTAGLDLARPALKVPAFGRVSLR